MAKFSIQPYGSTLKRIVLSKSATAFENVPLSPQDIARQKRTIETALRGIFAEHGGRITEDPYQSPAAGENAGPEARAIASLLEGWNDQRKKMTFIETTDAGGRALARALRSVALIKNEDMGTPVIPGRPAPGPTPA